MKPRMRVLKCILHSRFGGPHRRSFAIARRLRAEGIETTFLFGLRGDRLADEEGFDCVYLKHLQFMTRQHPAIHLLRFSSTLPFNVRSVRRLIVSKGIDIVDVDGVTNPVPALAGHRSGRPVIWCYNDHLPATLARLMLPWVGRIADRVVVQGETLRESRTGVCPRLRDKASVLYPGIDLTQFDPAEYDAEARRRWRAQWNLADEAALIGIIGNLNWLKGHREFLRAAARIKQRIPAAKFIIVGERLRTDAGYADGLQRLTAELGLQHDVIFTGFRTDIAATLAALDVFVLASVKESCPNVVLEAMAMKVPVVATNVGAVSELVGQGQTGMVVPPRDPEALANAVVACLNKPRAEIETMTEAARARVEAHFALEKIAEQQECLYEDLLKQKGD